MDSIFGLPMTTILIVVVSIMAACLATTAVIALRNPIIFKMALRNIPRRRAQTVLIMVGLMLSTLIMAASLTTGDTLDHSMTTATYDSLGQVDETIAFVGDTGNDGSVSAANVPIPAHLSDQLEQQLTDNPDIDAEMPVLTISAPVVNEAAELSEPRVVVTGLDPARLPAFGGLQEPGGADIDIANLPAGSVVLSDELAENLGAQVGDQVTLYFNNQPQQLNVGAIAAGSILTGYDVTLNQGGGPGSGPSVDLLGMAVPLGWLQELTGLEGQARFIAVSNTGGVEEGPGHSDAAVDALDAALADVEGGAQLGVNPIKADAIEGAQLAGSTFTTFFLIFGLFSISAGVLLIFMIFTMLAAERRSEMGMARAVGMSRNHLVQGFIAEGAAYDLGAALIGAAAGVLVAFGIAAVLGGGLAGDGAIEPYASWRSLIVAYALGVTVTFITIIFASVRASRLNIVAAIRDLPEEKHPERGERPRWSWWTKLGQGRAMRVIALPVALLWNVVLLPVKLLSWLTRLLAYVVGWGPIIAVAGGLIMIPGATAKVMFLFALGLSLLVLGLMLFLRRYLPTRLVFTAGAAVMLAYWLLPPSVTNRVLPDVGDGGPEMLVVSGIFMVLYSTLILMWNADLLVGLVSLLGRSFARWLPAVKMAVAYPLAAKGRTGMTIAMFSIVVFALVTVSTVSINFRDLFLSDDAAAGWDVRVVTSPSNPIDDLLATLTGSQVNVDEIDAIGRVETVPGAGSPILNVGSDNWELYPVSGVDTGFIDNAVVPLAARAGSYASDTAAWDAIRDGEPVALIDANVFEAEGGPFGGGEGYRAPSNIEISDGAFQPFEVQIQSPSGEVTQTVTIIGVIDQSVSTLNGIYLSETIFDDVYAGSDVVTEFYLTLDNASVSDSEAFANQVQGALRTTGVQADSILAEIEEGQEQQASFFTLIEGFMGLGLFVGLAALGVISFRSVVERRQQIGMLRAIGYQRGMVAASFLIESLVTATLGVLSGTVLAIALSYNLITGGAIGDEQFDGFIVPFGTIAVVILGSLVAAALMTWIPSRSAATVPIADALRYE